MGFDRWYEHEYGYDIPINSRKQISIFDLAEFFFAHLGKTREETIVLVREFIEQKYSVDLENSGSIRWNEAELREVLYLRDRDR